MMVAMQLTIDKFGRVVLPKKIRDHLGVHTGLKLSVIETRDGVLLKPVPEASRLRRKQGILIHGGESSGPIHWSTLLEKDREDRLANIVAS